MGNNNMFNLHNIVCVIANNVFLLNKKLTSNKL